MCKKIRIISGVLLIIFVLAIFGCSPKEETSETTKDKPLDIVFVGSVSSGTLNMVINAVSECINMSYHGSVTTIVPGSTGTNAIRINNHEGDLGVTNNVHAYLANQGSAPFTEKSSNIAAVASLYPSVLQIAFDKKTGVTTLEEFFENRMKLKISVGLSGSNAELIFQHILAEYGLTLDDINAWGGEIINQSINDSAQMLADGTIDGALFMTLVPVPNLLETATSRDFVIASVDHQILKNVIDKYPYQSAVIPADSYPGQTKAVQSISCKTILIVPKDSEEETAYKIARSLYENIEYLQDVHVHLSNLSPAFLASDQGIPLHPGAEKFYREKGLIK